MKKLFLLLAVLMPLLGQAKKTAPTKMRWCSFNLRVNAASDAEIGCSWESRRDRVCDWIHDNGIDIVCMQEVTTSMLPDLAERLPDFAYVAQGRRNTQRDEMVPVFYRKDKYQEVKHGTFWLSETPDSVGSRGWDGAHPRIATWMMLRDKATKQEFVVMSTHFDHKGQIARRESGLLLPAKLQSIAGKRPAFFCGDLNLTDTTEGYAAIVSSPYILRDTYFMAPHTGVRYTFHSFSRIEPDKAHRIDFQFVTPQIRVLQTHFEQNIPDAPLSDHNPIWADIEF